MTFPEQRTAVVTGAGAPRGIGRVVAARLAAQGWHLALLDVRDDGLSDFAAELARDAGVTVHPATVDVTDPAAVTALFERLDAELPPVVGLVNLAGIACPTPLLDLTLAEWQASLAVNATGTFLMIQSAARRMAAVGVGRIVTTSSITALDGGGTFSKTAYAASKAAVLGLTKGAARELGPSGITVNAILPGPIDTDIMGGALSEERKTAMSAGIPVGRVGAPADVAALVAFLLGEDAGYCTGGQFQVDGGKLLH